MFCELWFCELWLGELRESAGPEIETIVCADGLASSYASGCSDEHVRFWAALNGHPRGVLAVRRVGAIAVGPAHVEAIVVAEFKDPVSRHADRVDRVRGVQRAPRDGPVRPHPPRQRPRQRIVVHWTHTTRAHRTHTTRAHRTHPTRARGWGIIGARPPKAALVLPEERTGLVVRCRNQTTMTGQLSTIRPQQLNLQPAPTANGPVMCLHVCVCAVMDE